MTSAHSSEREVAHRFVIALERAEIGTAKLSQHEVRIVDDGHTVLLAMALGPARLWSYLTNTALDGFQTGFDKPYDGRASSRLHQGLLVAQQAVRNRAEALVERRLPDVGLIALTVDGPILHVLAAGPLRAYVHRRTVMRCLGGKATASDGLLKGSPVWCAEPIEAGDLVFMASLSACSEPVLSEVKSALDENRATAADDVARALTAAARRDGSASACVAFRVEASLIASATAALVC